MHIENSFTTEENPVTKEFSRFAEHYGHYNHIQAKVATSLVSGLPQKPYHTFVDIGCGSGEVYKNLIQQKYNYQHFIATDASSKMLSLHPTDKSVQKRVIDFNHTFHLQTPFVQTVLLSASALQWSHDLDFTFKALSTKASEAYFAIFTSNTFETLHQIAEVKSPIYSSDRLQRVINNYYKSEFILKQYQLSFDSIAKMFDYIKKSGVSGGEKKLSYQATKRVLTTYPLDYLEFEVLFVKAKSRVIF